VIQNAIDLSLEKNLDLEDVLQCLCVKENGCNALISNDKEFVDCGVSIYTTDEFLLE
jgi:predicted nucleic acid-binding protein